MRITTSRELKWTLSIVAVVLSTLLVISLEHARQQEPRRVNQPGADSWLSYRLPVNPPGTWPPGLNQAG